MRSLDGAHATVSGSSGFIGSEVCRQLDSCGASVHRLNREFFDTATPSTASFGGEPPSVVFHLASRVHQFDGTRSAVAEHEHLTVEGTRRLLKVASAVRCQSFVFFSTCAVMGGGGMVLDESAPTDPKTPYAWAKLSAEKLVLDANGTNGMATTVLRLPTVYGRGHKGPLAAMIRAIRAGWFPALPDFQGKRSLVHVADAAAAALACAASPIAAGKVYIVCEQRAYSSHEIYELVSRVLGRPRARWAIPRPMLSIAALLGDQFEVLTRRPATFDSSMLARLSESAQFTAARINRDLGFCPSHDFETSLVELVS